MLNDAAYRAEVSQLLNIPNHLLRGGKGEGGLIFNYNKYKACIQAISMAESMANSGEWPIRRPSETEIVELFIGKSMWYSHFKKTFSRVPKYPQMLKWLNEDDDALPTIDLWGEEKGSFSFTDLKKWMDREDIRISQKGKVKEKTGHKKGKKGKKGKIEGSEDEDMDRKKRKKRKEREEGSSKKHFTRSKGKTK
jgi:hypothetical protein